MSVSRYVYRYRLNCHRNFQISTLGECFIPKVRSKIFSVLAHTYNKEVKTIMYFVHSEPCWMIMWKSEITEFCVSADPCTLYTTLDRQYKRSARYVADGTADNPYLCDLHMEEGWYYFDGGQGDNMSTYAPPINSCGTMYPVWLNGKSA